MQFTWYRLFSFFYGSYSEAESDELPPLSSFFFLLVSFKVFKLSKKGLILLLKVSSRSSDRLNYENSKYHLWSLPINPFLFKNPKVMHFSISLLALKPMMLISCFADFSNLNHRQHTAHLPPPSAVVFSSPFLLILLLPRWRFRTSSQSAGS